MTESISALRSSVYSALNAALSTVQVSKYHRRPGTARRHTHLLEIGIESADETDTATVTLRLTCSGKLTAAEAAIDNLTQAVEDALPVTVAAPVWTIFYDQDAALWTATGSAPAFRE